MKFDALSDPEVVAGAPQLGTVVWARVEGWPWWPAVVVPQERALFMRREASRPGMRAVKATVHLFVEGKLLSCSRISSSHSSPTVT